MSAFVTEGLLGCVTAGFDHTSLEVVSRETSVCVG